MPALVIATYRDDELTADHPLRSVLGELRVSHGVRRIELPPLSLEAVGALAAPADADTADLYRVTGGNPFFVTEVLATGGNAFRRRCVTRSCSRGEALRSGAQAARGDRRGSAEDRPLAVGGRGRRLLETLEDSVGSGMLDPGQADAGFRHELARVAIEDSIPPNRRVALHRAVLTALEDRGGASPDLARLADHAEAARAARGRAAMGTSGG